MNSGTIYLAQAEATTPEAAESTALPPPPQAPAAPSGFDPSMFMVMAIAVLAFMFLIQRPEKKRQAERLKALEGLKKGDKVVSNSGIHGVVARTNKGKDTIFVTVAKDVELEFSRTALSQYTEPEKKDEPAAEAAEEPKKKAKV